MWLEVFLAIMQNVSTGAAVVLFISTVFGLVLCILSPIIMDELNIKSDKAWVFAKCYLVAWFIVGLFACFPSVDELWKVRIGLIKLHLASPENVQKGADVIERIGKKLECKYLGCENTETKESK